MIVRQSADSRNLKKLTGKSTWFKEKKKPDEQERIEGAGEEKGRGTTCTSARQAPSGGLCEAPTLGLTTSSGAVLSPIFS